MSDQSLLLSLRNAVVDSADQFLCGAFESAQPGQEGWSAEEQDALESCLLLMALRMLESQGRLHVLGYLRKTTLADLDARDLGALAGALHDRLRAFCGEDIRDLVAPPSQAAISNMISLLPAFMDQKLARLWQDEASLGYAYQFFCGRRRKDAQNKIQSANKTLTHGDLIAFTQLYTPRWVVDYLLVNTILPLWQGKTREGQNAWQLGQPNYRGKLYQAPDINVLDPASGCGHFLLRAFDLLLSMHESEGFGRDESIAAVATKNLAGADIDPMAIRVNALSLLIKCLSLTDKVDFSLTKLVSVGQSNRTTGDTKSLMGSLSKDFECGHVLSLNYAAIVTNPPYIGRKLLSRQFRSQLKEAYPQCHHDLCATFVLRGLELLKEEGGRLGLITQASLMFLPSYSQLRQNILADHRLISAVDLGTGVFPLQSGEKVNSVLLVIEKAQSSPAPARDEDGLAVFFDVTRSKDKEEDLRQLLSGATQSSNKARRYDRDTAAFLRLPGRALNYACPSAVLEAAVKLKPLSTVADVRQGLATTDNKRFVRNWWDVDASLIGSTWFPYVKGAGSERWYSPVRHLVRWQNDGAEIKQAVNESYPYLKGKTAWVVKNEQFYFKAGLCFSFVNTHQLCVRKLPAGCIFDVGASAVFPQSDMDENFLLAYLNSSFIAALAKGLNPTINFQVGDIKKLPILLLSRDCQHLLSELGGECIALKKQLAALTGSGLDLHCPRELADLLEHEGVPQESERILRAMADLQSALADREAQVDDLVLAAAQRELGLSKGERLELRCWMDDTSERRRGAAVLPTGPQLAQQALHQCLLKLLTKHDQILLPLSAPDWLGALSLSASALDWLKAQLESDLCSYLLKQHAPYMNKAFDKSPPYLLHLLPESKCLLLFSTDGLRRMPGNGGGQSPESAALIGRLAKTLERIPDWTGADAALALKSGRTCDEFVD